MVGIERDVGNSEFSCAVGFDVAIVTAHRIMNFDGGAGDNGTAGIGDYSLQRSAGRLRGSLNTEEEHNTNEYERREQQNCFHRNTHSSSNACWVKSIWGSKVSCAQELCDWRRTRGIRRGM